MKEGDVWKYGETIQGEKRYGKSSYEKNSFKMQPLFYGTKTEILVQEKIMLYWYYFLTSSLKKHVFYNLLINNIMYLCVT